MAVVKNWVKVAGVDFLRKFLLCLKWDKWIIFGPKISTFLKLYLMTTTKKWLKVTVRDDKNISIFSKIYIKYGQGWLWQWHHKILLTISTPKFKQKFKCSKLTIETLEKDVKYALSCNDVVLVSLLITFSHLFFCFHCWLWGCVCLRK